MDGVDIPVDVISEIILYLPLKSLLRFRLVSKAWLHVIDVARSVGTLKKSAFIFLKLNFRSAYMVEGDEAGRPLNSRELIYSGPTYNPIGYPIPAPYANGLLYFNPLLWESARIPNTYIYNPATQCHIQLPSITITKPISIPFLLLAGFGFDPTSKKFKVIQLLQSKNDERNPSSPFIQQAYMFKLHPNACRNQNQNQNRIHKGSWQELHNVPKVRLYPRSSVLVNASLHWLTFSHENRILSIDLTTDKFHFIEIPKLACKFFYKRSLGLVAWRGCLAIYDFNYYFAEIWMMKDYSSKEAWTQIKFSSTIFKDYKYLGTFHPISFSKKGDVLLLYACSKLVIVNVETGRNSSQLDIRDVLGDNTNDMCSFAVYPYTGETPYHQYI